MISYARLVHPIAPYAILTNGSEWRIFESITKIELKPEEIQIKDRYHLALPDAARNAAIDFFLGYSIENLLQFCWGQVGEQLKPLAGSPQDLTKKYIAELTTPRDGLLHTLAAFESAAANGFLLLAESGIGKTSALCDYVLRRLREKKPTLFFSGATLETGLLAAITNEFSWTFTEELTPVMLIRRLSELAKDSPVVIVIDAIDEWPYAQRAQSLLNRRSSRKFVAMACSEMRSHSISAMRPQRKFKRSRNPSGKTPTIICSSMPPWSAGILGRSTESWRRATVPSWVLSPSTSCIAIRSGATVSVAGSLMRHLCS